MTKIKPLLVILAFIIVILLIIANELNKTIIKSDKVWGESRSRHQDAYHILNTKHEEIPSTLSQINDMADNSFVNVDYLVIYEERKWDKEQRNVLKILRFERAFPDFNLQSTNTMYYRLVDEMIEDIDEKHSVFIRLYEKYEQNHNLWSLEPTSIIIPRVESMIEAKQKIKETNADFLTLLPITIVEDDLLKRWENEKYVPSLEYTHESPEALTIEDIINTQH